MSTRSNIPSHHIITIKLYIYQYLGSWFFTCYNDNFQCADWPDQEEHFADEQDQVVHLTNHLGLLPWWQDHSTVLPKDEE